MTSINELIARATRTQHPDELYDEGMRLAAEADRLLKTAIRHANAGKLKQAERKGAEGQQLETKARELFAAWKKLTQEIYDEALRRAGGDKNVRLIDITDEAMARKARGLEPRRDGLLDDGRRASLDEPAQIAAERRAFGEEVLKRKDRK